MKFFNKSFSVLAITCLSSNVMGHANYMSKDNLDQYSDREYQENSSSYLNLVISHGCKDDAGNTYSTKYVGVVFPNKMDLQDQVYTEDKDGKRYGGNAVMGIKASIDNNWQTIRQIYSSVSSYYNHGEKTEDVIAIHWLDGNVPYDMYAELKFRIKFPKLDKCLSRLKVYTPTIQYCEGNQVMVWAKKATTLFSEEVISPNYAPYFEVVRDLVTNPLPDSCTAEETLEVEPTAQEIDWYFSPRDKY